MSAIYNEAYVVELNAKIDALTRKLADCREQIAWSNKMAKQSGFIAGRAFERRESRAPTPPSDKAGKACLSPECEAKYIVCANCAEKKGKPHA